MKLSDHLSDKQKRQIERISKTKKKRKAKPKKKEENVNWIDIMGMNRDRFTRGRGGAMRRGNKAINLITQYYLCCIIGQR